MAEPATVTRLAGAILLQTQGEYFLVGDLKEPCDFVQHGFERPAPGAADQKQPYIRLKAVSKVNSDEEVTLIMEGQGEALAQLLFKRFVILRNHSVSERLWRVAAGAADAQGRVDARWLEQMPDDVWEIVRENILKCL